MLAAHGAPIPFPLLKMPIAEFAKERGQDARHRDDRRRVTRQRLPGREARQLVWFVDATVEPQPMVVSNYTVPESERQFLPARRPLRLAFRRTRAWRRSSTRRSPSSPSSTRASGRSISAIRFSRRKSRTSSRRSPRRPTSAASRLTGRTSARSRSRATMSRPTIAATSMWSTAPIPACISSS